MEAIKITPQFDDLTPETIESRIQQYREGEPMPNHADILNQLLEQVQPIDFKLLAYPQVEKIRKRLKRLKVIQDATQSTEAIEKEIESGDFQDHPNSEAVLDELRKLKKCKLQQKHYLVLSVENVLRLAKTNNWQMCLNNNTTYLYNGAYWRALDSDTLKQFLGEAAEKMGVQRFDARFHLFKDQLLKQFFADAYLPTPEPPQDRVLINLQNGTFEISPQGTTLRSFNPHDFITYQLPFNYDLEAKAPIFEKYLNRVLPDTDRQKVLAEYMGFVFVRHGSEAIKEEKALILYGSGANGKSVFFEIINALLGKQNVSGFSLQTLTNETGYQRAEIATKLLNYASEINGKLEASTFKLLVSGEPVEARSPYGRPFTMTHYAKLLFNCNELPKEVEHTHAFFRRFLIVPFDATIPEAEQDKELHRKIIDRELSGVFNWVLEGLKRLLEQKRFTDCEAVQKAVEQYQKESDPVKLFIEDFRYQPSAIEQKPLSELYAAFKVYCTDNGYRTCANRTLSTRLKGAGYQIERKAQGMVVFIESENEDQF